MRRGSGQSAGSSSGQALDERDVVLNSSFHGQQQLNSSFHGQQQLNSSFHGQQQLNSSFHGQQQQQLDGSYHGGTAAGMRRTASTEFGSGNPSLARISSSGSFARIPSASSFTRIPSNNSLSRLHVSVAALPQSESRNRFDAALEAARARSGSLSDSLNGYSLVGANFQPTRPDDDVELSPRRRGSSNLRSLSSATTSTSLADAAEAAAQVAATSAAAAAAAAATASAAAAADAEETQLHQPHDPLAPPPPRQHWLAAIVTEVVLSGDMPNAKAYVLRNHRRNLGYYLLFWLDVVLRGVSQVYLCDHPVSGVLILLGLVCTSGSLAAMSLLGSLCSTLGAHLACRPPLDTITSGLCGYDGALVGCACWAFLDFQSLPLEAALVAAVLSFTSGVLHVALTNLMKTFNLPTFTFAFNMTTIAFLLSLKTKNAATMPLAQPAPPVFYPADYVEFDWSFMWDASVRGVGQFMFADTTAGGILVILGIAVSSRIGALAAWGGAAVAAITAVQLLVVSPANRIDVRNGLYGYNSAGTCASLAGGIFFDPTPSGAVFGILGAALAVLILGMFKALLGTLFGLPVLTFPFIVTTWIMLLTQSKLLVPYPAPSTGIPIIRFEVKVWNALTQQSPASTSWLATGSSSSSAAKGKGLPVALFSAVANFFADLLLFPTALCDDVGGAGAEDGDDHIMV